MSRKNKPRAPLERFVDSTGVRITKCCASCQFRQYHTYETRLCKRGYGVVYPSDPPCSQYQPRCIVSNKAAIGQGKVKRKAYLDFFANNYLRVYTLGDAEDVYQRLREEFEEKTNLSVYHNI